MFCILVRWEESPSKKVTVSVLCLWVTQLLTPSQLPCDSNSKSKGITSAPSATTELSQLYYYSFFSPSLSAALLTAFPKNELCLRFKLCSLLLSRFLLFPPCFSCAQAVDKQLLSVGKQLFVWLLQLILDTFFTVMYMYFVCVCVQIGCGSRSSSCIVPSQ